MQRLVLEDNPTNKSANSAGHLLKLSKRDDDIVQSYRNRKTVSCIGKFGAVIDAILTRKGRELLAKNDGSFRITAYAFGDDEINYGLYDPTASDPDAAIKNLPVLEPISNETVALNYRLISLPQGSIKIATLSLKPTQATTDYGDTVTFTVDTDNGEDPNGWAVQSRDTDIAVPETNRISPDANGIGTVKILTGLGKSGQTILDIYSLNSGARSTFSLTVSASGV